MPRINLLEPQVAELIAAGEVVDRPASVVKELVENALDAGARRVTVELGRGGIGLIRVVDDGCGIDREEVSHAFVRHATSKIATAADLDAIATLGFRGEALPSVAAVSRVSMTTRTKDAAAGLRFSLDGSGNRAQEEVGCPVGTSVEVRDLFYNTPARMKFLKKDATEGNAVASLLDRLALCRPDIAFTLIRDGQKKLQTPGDGDLLSAIRVVCGSDVALQMLPVDQTGEGIAVTGYVSRPTVGRATRALQICFINGRYIRSRTIVAAVEEAYKNRLMTGRHPVLVLNLSIDTALVDVNVHPAKLEVRFSSERAVYSAVYAATLSALAGGERPVAQAAQKKRLTPFDLTDFDHSDWQLKLGTDATGLILRDDTAVGLPPLRPVVPSAGRPTPTAQPRDAIDKRPPPVASPAPAAPVPPSTVPVRAAPVWPLARPDIECDEPAPPPAKTAAPVREAVAPSAGQTPAPGAVATLAPPAQAEPAPPPMEEPTPYRLIGELFDTYAVVEQGESLLLIDKHAAHERAIYNAIKHEGEASNRQVLLSPQAVTLPRDEYFALVQHPEALTALGLVAEDFGEGTLLIREVPMLLDGCDLSALLSEAAANLLRHKSDLTPGILDELLYSVSCRAAVMAGKKSARPELERLVELVLGPEQIRHCPHGRPVKATLTRRELEKLFGRQG